MRAERRSTEPRDRHRCVRLTASHSAAAPVRVCSRLAKQDLQGIQADGGDQYLYAIRVCGNVTSVPSCVTDGASFCEIDVPAANRTYPTGYWSTRKWSYVGGDWRQGIMYTMTGARCWTPFEYRTYVTNVVVRTNFHRSM